MCIYPIYVGVFGVRWRAKNTASMQTIIPAKEKLSVLVKIKNKNKNFSCTLGVFILSEKFLFLTISFHKHKYVLYKYLQRHRWLIKMNGNHAHLYGLAFKTAARQRWRATTTKKKNKW